MKRILSVVLSSLLLVLSVPVIPAKSAPLYLTGDQAYEIYLSLLSLIETGRLASGYDNSIFSSDFADFQSNIAEINSYLASHSTELNGIDFYWTDGSSALKEDWVDEDWDLDDDGTADATGSLSNKLTVLTQDKIDELEDFNAGMHNNSFNEENNNPFDILKRVAIGAAVTAGGVFACLKGFWNIKTNISDDPYSIITFPEMGYDMQSGSYQGNICLYRGDIYTCWNNFGTIQSYNYFYKSSDSQYYFSDARNQYSDFYDLGYHRSLNMKTGTFDNYAVYINFDVHYLSSNVPIFSSRQDAYAFLINHDLSKAPLNLRAFDYNILYNNFNNSLLPLIDTNIRPYGFIGINNGLSVARQNLALSADSSANSNLWIIEVPDTIGDIVPEFIPDYDPIPPPQPIPDPDPIPDPIPDPEPEPDPEPDIGDPIIDDEGDLTEIPIVSGLQGRFPFSIPWDIKHLVSNLSAEREAPAFEYDFYISPRWLPPNGFLYHFDIDLAPFDNLASLFRRLFLLSFIIGLAVYSYAKFFGGGE